MLQSLVPRPPLSSNPNSIKAKCTERENDDGDSTVQEPSFKRPNFSADKTVAEGEEHEEEQAFEPEPEAEGKSTGLKLLGHLLQCAECVAMDNLNFANDLLPKITEYCFTASIRACSNARCW